MPPRMPKGQQTKAKKGTMKRLLKVLFKNYKWYLIASAICILLYSIGNLASSVFVKNITAIIEQGVLTKEPLGGVPEDIAAALLKQFIIIGVIYLIGLVAAFLYTRLMTIVTNKYLFTLRKQLFEHMQTLPIKYFDTHPRGDVMSLYTNDVDTMRQMVSQALPSALQTGTMVIGSIGVMLYNSLYLSLIIFFGAIFMLLNTVNISKKSAKFFLLQQKATGKVEGNVEESINGLKVIKVFSHEEKSIEDFSKLNDELADFSTQANINSNIMMPINGNIGNLLYVVLALVGVVLVIFKVPNPSIEGVIQGIISSIRGEEATWITQMATSTILLFLVTCRQFTNNVSNFSQQFSFIIMGQAGASRLFDLIDEPSEVDEGYVTLVHIKKHPDGTFEETTENTRDYAWKHPHGDGTLTYTELKGDIVLDHVDFGYREDHIVLHDVSIYAHPGQKIAFVGATGAGKTTITNLINRFYNIADGKIRYDGININKIKLDDLRKSLGIVLQDTNLFTGTVMDNIRYGRLDATDEECIEASKIANAYDFITRLPEGFNTMLVSDGANLSQGQRQLLSIARAAVSNAPVMILDEATSSIDTRTEKLVGKGMDNLMKGRTVFVIAHRLSTVQDSQAIMVLDHGRIIERGTHEQLIEQKGVYYQLYTGAFELE